MAKSQKQSKKPQIEKFRDKARELECDDDEKKFGVVLGKVARHKPTPKNQREKSS